MRPFSNGAKFWAATAALLGVLMPGAAIADERVEARRHFNAGMEYIESGEFEAGIVELEAAYDVSPHPFVLFNIGRAHFEMGNLDEAEQYILNYLEEDPPDRPQVEAFLAKIHEAQKSRVIEAEVPAPPPQQVVEVPQNLDIQELAAQMYAIMGRLESVLNEGADATGTPNSAGSPLLSPTPAPEPVVEEQPPEDELKPTAQQTPRPEAPRVQDIDPYQRQVITASRSIQNPLDAPNAITVITSEDIRQSAARTLPDVLRRVPGIDVMANGPGDFNIGIRGFNSTLANKVLVLVDGRSVYLDFIGATLWPLLSISPSDVERIEVIRGPGAALYGAGAFSGVINIITKNPGATDDNNSVTVRTGLPDWVDGNAHLTGRTGTTGYRASVGFEQIERWSIEVDPNREDYEIYANSPDKATNLTRFDGRLDQRIGEDSALSLSGGMASGQVEFTAIGAIRDFLVDGNYGYLRADLTLPKGLTGRMFWNYFDVDTSPWASPTGTLGMNGHQVSNIIDTEIEANEVFHLGVEHRLNVGVGHRFKTIDWDYLDGARSEHHLKFFVQDQMQLGPDVTGYLSLRMDRHPLLAERTDSELGFFDKLPTSPRAAVVWRFKENQSLRGTVGTAFRNPSFLESYLDLPIATSNDALAVLSAGNQELGPERILSAEVGYMNLPSDERYEVQGAVYANRVTDLIVLGDVDSSDPITGVYDPDLGFWYAGSTAHQNLSGAQTALGAELAVTLFPVDGVDVYANYSFEYVQREDGTVVSSTSPNKFNGGVQYRGSSGLELGVDLHYVDRQLWDIRSFNAAGQAVVTTYQVPSYAWMGLRVGYRPSDRFELAIEGTNVLDLLRGEIEGGGGLVETPAGRHREYPTGQLVPVGISGVVTYRF